MKTKGYKDLTWVFTWALVLVTFCAAALSMLWALPRFSGEPTYGENPSLYWSIWIGGGVLMLIIGLIIQYFDRHNG